jgi:hypothetical protein
MMWIMLLILIKFFETQCVKVQKNHGFHNNLLLCIYILFWATEIFDLFMKEDISFKIKNISCHHL